MLYLNLYTLMRRYLFSSEGCPIQPGSSMQKVIYLVPELSSNKDRRGIALDGQLKCSPPTLASSTLLVMLISF